MLFQLSPELPGTFKYAQRAPQDAPNDLPETSCTPKSPPGAPKISQRIPQLSCRDPLGTPSAPHGLSMTAPGTPQGLHETPKGRQRTLKALQDVPWCPRGLRAPPPDLQSASIHVLAGAKSTPESEHFARIRSHRTNRSSYIFIMFDNIRREKDACGLY